VALELMDNDGAQLSQEEKAIVFFRLGERFSEDEKSANTQEPIDSFKNSSRYKVQDIIKSFVDFRKSKRNDMIKTNLGHFGAQGTGSTHA